MTTSREPITMQVVSRDEELSGRLVSLAASGERERGFSCRVNRVEQLEANAGVVPQLVVIDLDSMSDGVLEHIPHFREQGLRSPIVVAAQRPSSERLLRAMRAGANDYIPAYPTLEEFNDLLARVREATAQGDGRPRGRLVTVFSNKGGVGTTTVAINVAASLATHVRGAVVVDLVLQHGDLSVFLDVPTTYTIANLAAELDRADVRYLRSVLPRHAAGVHVLPAPNSPDEAELVTPEQVTVLLSKLREAFDAVVVDVGNEFNECALAAMDASDRVLALTLPDLASVRNTRRSLDLFARLNYDPAKVVLVVNRHNAKEPLSRKALEEALGRPVQWTIPNDYLAVVRAINQGTALRLVQPKGALSINIDRLATMHVLGRTAASLTGRRWGRPSWLGRALRRGVHNGTS